MSFMRQRFDVNAGSGVWTDTGPSFTGAVLQMAWNPSTPDTGGDLQISLVPVQGSDTGDSWHIFDDNDCLGADFIKAPRQRTHAFDGTPDTGIAVPIVAHGDRLRVKVTPGGTAVVGQLYVWTVD